MAGTDQSRQNMWRKMLNYAVHRNVPGAYATYWSAAKLLAPLHGSDWDAPALGGFYYQAFNGLVSLPVAGYNYNSDWTPSVGGTCTRWNGS
jgi:hypothetical protein